MVNIALSEYIKQLLSLKIDESDLKQSIGAFSRFLGYTNPDYVYNGTYLSQYTEEFIRTVNSLKSKNEKYQQIFFKISELGYYYVLLIDGIFYAHHIKKEDNQKTKDDNQIGYIGIDKDKISSSKIEVKVRIIDTNGDNEYLISKTYDDYKDEKLIESIVRNIEKYISLKRKKEIEV